MVHIGDEYTKLSELIGYCEAQIEASLQLALQYFIIIVVFSGRIIPSSSIYRSLVTSTITILLAISKALMSHQVNHTKKTSKLKQIKQTVWIISLSGIIFITNIVVLTNLFAAVIKYGKDYYHMPPLMQKDYLIESIIHVTLIMFMCIFMYKNCFKQHLQTKVRFIILSIYHIFNCMAFSMALINSFCSEDFNNSIGFILPIVQHLILHSSLVLVFAKAAVSATKLNDIWSLEKMTSSELCRIPNFLFTIVFLSFFYSSLNTLLYSFHVPSTRYK